MSKRVLVGEVAELPIGEGRTFAVAGRRLALFHTRSGEIFATQAECPHKGGPLADGLIGGTTVMCPLHDRLYELRTGQGPESECAIEVYAVSLGGDGKIWVQLSDETLEYK
jgi:nitrite reductase (NADH) small subunit